ncbi:hypothetical protein K437DRAFT_273277 [Tilletiaria anomala UBC 951]|uniref:Nuclear speckle splicing regulatory protein 1 N-terminal domain-containing protein n=1 Tax=Tilletiaria anomala (strain ATCC 24038 / CBS 436.72 / UBC 951) TaxID=1037660 RepID=A0A066WEK5_TILAU|nr:uncharacterized protein K437DRAFT_273277 [Tilletiaria anomala UBC 951]KDN49195.1 hypothetical protein K437DRAFT_273277 [Tilletiaria anomala UBC 951]
MQTGTSKISFGLKKSGDVPPQAGTSKKPFKLKLGSAASLTKEEASSATRPPAALSLGGEDLEEDVDDAPSATATAKREPKKGASKGNTLGIGSKAAPASRSSQLAQDAALVVDASIFDYDAAYEKMQQAKHAVKERKDAEKAERKPKYIGNFLDSAELRKRDRARAEAKMIQREREREGDEFEETEVFVTDAYREQLEEIKRLEEKEAKEEEELRNKAKSGGPSFFKEMLQAQDQDHEAIVQAVEASTRAGEAGRSDKGKEKATGSDTQKGSKKSDLELARDARAKGLQVELNDEGELVDRRDVLSRGLNVIRTERNAQADMNRVSNRSANAPSSQLHGAGFDARVSQNARRDQRARQTLLIEQQMLEEERKRAAEEEHEREERKKRIMGVATAEDVAKRAEKVNSARERALERKRKREEEKAQAGA